MLHGSSKDNRWAGREDKTITAMRMLLEELGNDVSLFELAMKRCKLTYSYMATSTCNGRLTPQFNNCYLPLAYLSIRPTPSKIKEFLVKHKEDVLHKPGFVSERKLQWRSGKRTVFAGQGTPEHKA